MLLGILVGEREEEASISFSFSSASGGALYALLRQYIFVLFLYE